MYINLFISLICNTKTLKTFLVIMVLIKLLYYNKVHESIELYNQSIFKVLIMVLIKNYYYYDYIIMLIKDFNSDSK